ncbi:MAG: hypothetical protein GX344_00300 [Intrasporangiaceae bacterium]|nr:hypothetical protein [Intrasporangiaceae bacterium]
MNDITRLHVRQKVTVMVNQYWVSAADEAGSARQLLAFAQQKRMKLREEVSFFTDESRREVAFGFQSRQVIDMAATTDVFDAHRNPIGVFRKDAVKSLLNSTWHITAGNVSATGQERSQNVALARRFGDMLPIVGDVMGLIPWQFHFDFTDPAGTSVLSVERQRKVRDNYLTTIRPDSNGTLLDWRFAAAITVALDAFQGR